MKNLILSLLVTIALTTALPANAECPSDDGDFCSWYEWAEQGDAEAQTNLGNMYRKGQGVIQDYREAVRWYSKAADQGNASAQTNLGWMYDNGKGVNQDKREAVRWYRKSAEQGVPEAQYNLAVMYANGQGVTQDYREAVRWYRKAAEQGYAGAQLNLGVMYSNGEGVKQDKRVAVRWYRKSAEQGVAKAQFNLGLMYDNGEGVIQDYREAVRWYRKAADQGFADAQHNLGVMYANGEGVTEDDREVVRWFRKAAQQGYANAQYNLGVTYWNGDGVITDKRESYIWYSIAKANGYEEAAVNLRTSNWGKFLTTAEIKSAQREAARRLQAIDQRIDQHIAQGKTDSAENAPLGNNIALAEPSKRANIAERVFEQAWRSVVIVHNGDSQGSGVIIRPNVVATNCHVVDEGGDIVVYKASNRRADTDTPFMATLRHTNTEQDFCLLDVDGLWGVPATVRQYATLRVGEDVYNLGAPQGFDLSLSAGIVSQLRDIAGYQLIQTDAAISPAHLAAACLTETEIWSALRLLSSLIKTWRVSALPFLPIWFCNIEGSFLVAEG